MNANLLLHRDKPGGGIATFPDKALLAWEALPVCTTAQHKPAAVFLDRDGTLMEDVGFLADPDGIQVFDDTVSALLRLQERFVLFVITNQSGVGDGLIRLEDAHRVNAELDRRLAQEGIRIREWYVCPHAKKDECACRKPKPEFVLKAARDYGIDLQRSYSIGDHPHDAELGKSLGVTGLYVLTGHGTKHREELPPDTPVFPGIGEATTWILRHDSWL